MLPQRVAKIFSESWMPEPNSGCWLWLNRVDDKGYGWISISVPDRRAHRISWLIHKGEIPNGLHVLHHCDTPSCVNPNHLFLGTSIDNVRDRDNKERMMRGVMSPIAKLTDELVRAIRQDSGSERQLAREYGVSPRLIHYVKHRQRWKHVP